LSEVDGYKGDSGLADVCVNALNDNGTWAGTGKCVNFQFGYVYHPYCACALRYGYVNAEPAQFAPASGWAIQYW
jgi:hypothetical protein